LILPIGHDQTISRHQWVTYGIMAVCLLVQAYVSFGTSDDELALRWGYLGGSGLHRNLILSAFVHDGWIHVVGNMLFLWLVGSVLEDRWGRAAFLAFYLLSAAAATLCFDLVSGADNTVLIGASGAVSAAMGAFVVLCWSARIRFLYWFYVAAGTFQLPAWFALALWLLEQLLWASGDSGGASTGVAYTAHVGGFAFGLVVALVARQGWLQPRTWLDKATTRSAAAAAALPVAVVRPVAPPAIAPMAAPPTTPSPVAAAAPSPTTPSPVAAAAPSPTTASPVDGGGPRFLT